MSRPDSVVLLNQLLGIHYHSLPMYLKDAAPWTRPGDEQAIEVIRRLIADHRATSKRLAEAIAERRGVLDAGEFPMSFTGIHDVALDYLIGRLIDCQKVDIESIDKISSQLIHDPHARSLADECLGAAKGHLESLEELAGQPTTT